MGENRLSFFKKCCSLVLMVILVTASSSILTISAATKYSGSGTKTDPYLVQTPEQLDGIRDNLSAHYKLANTIDLSSWGDFSPIGHMDKPFTGSLVCDAGSDGKALYAIKNLKVYVADKTYTDYISENVNKWEAGLFGCTSGATFTNIYIFNADIYNGVEGMNNGSKVYGNYHPGGDEQGTGVLVGFARFNTNITGCIATGKIKSRSNSTGGLIGNLSSGSATSCAAMVNIESTGNWHTGGFCGGVGTAYLSDNDTGVASFSFCYSTGTVSGSCLYGNLKGGFIGATGMATISNCYSTGDVNHNMGNNFAGNYNGNTTVMTNCYVTGTTTGIKADENLPLVNATNCFILNTVSKQIQQNFKSASAQEILTAFSGLKGWNTTDVALPQITSIPTVSADDYVPGAATAVADVQAATTQTGSSQTEQSAGAEQSTEETEEAEEYTSEDFIGIVEALPDISKIKISDKEKIIKAQKILDSLSESEYSKIDTKLIAKLKESREAICKKLVGDITERIEKLPKVEKLKFKDKANVVSIYEDFQFLTDTYKNAINEDAIDKLEKAYAKVKDMAETQSAYRTLTTPEKIVAIVLSSLIVIIMAINVFVSVLVIKKIRYQKKGTKIEPEENKDEEQSKK